MRSHSPTHAYIIAARRTALGRVGGLHRNRRLEDLTAPVVAKSLADARINPSEVDEIVIGNATQGGNPARLIALAAGLPETTAAATIDRQCGSGLDAILSAIRSIEAGDAEVVVAGGAESISTAPWRVAKPKSLYQLPHFIGIEPAAADRSEDPQLFEASEALSRTLGIGRERQDAWALRSHLKAGQAREHKRFVSEIVPLRATVEEARDQTGDEPSLDELEKLAPFLPPKGTLTTGNTSQLHDGAAIVVVVSEAVWQRLGKPGALRLVASAAQGVAPDREAEAPMAAMQKLYQRMNGFNPKDIGLVEMSESSAAQAIAFGASLGLDDDIVNPDGGAVVRGHPLGAASAVLVVRLYSRMVRSGDERKVSLGVAALGTNGGMGLAALFERL